MLSPNQRVEILFLREFKHSGLFLRALNEAVGFPLGRLTVWMVCDPRDPELCRRGKNDPTLVVSVSENRVTVGPFHVTKQSVCPACLQYWAKTAGFDRGNLRPARREDAFLAAEIVATIALKLWGEQPPTYLADSMLVVDTHTLLQTHHPVFGRQDCTSCRHRENSGGSDLRGHCSSQTGIVRRMDVTTHPVSGAHRAAATWVSPLPVPGARPLLDHQESYGNGVNRKEAECACIGEAIERYSLIYRGDEPLVRGTLQDLPAIDPSSILLYSARQYEEREKWNQQAEDHYLIPEPFDPARPIHWMAGIDLSNGKETFAPAACTLMWYAFKRDEPRYASGDTIGCGSGVSFEDALAHALLEWVERDAISIWWYNQLGRPSARIDSFNSDALIEVQRGIRSTGRELTLLDVTTDIGIPTYVSVSARPDGSQPLFAGASHPSPLRAAWKAAVEVGQIWFMMMRRREVGPEMGSWITTATTGNQPYLAPSSEVIAPPEPDEITSEDLVPWIITKLLLAGLRPYSVDLSRHDTALKTARAIVPGMRHVWNRRAPGRLFDVPVKMGWRHRPLAEEELNSICCMI